VQPDPVPQVAEPAAQPPDARSLLSPREQQRYAPGVRFEPITVKDGVVSLDGYGVRIAVEKGHLVLTDGIGSTRRASRFSRATCGIKRLVVRGSAYFITGDAVAWLTDIGASFLNLGFDGELLTLFSPPGHDDARLRRAQALAPWTDTGTDLIKHLLREKLLGQLHNVERFFAQATESIGTLRAQLDDLAATDDHHQFRSAEATAASAYWSAWDAVPVQFARKDAKRIPAHWATFGSRLSAVTGRPQRATNLANALLNYLYSILEAETTVACRTVGLDPGMGLLHTDAPNRSSLAFDIMETVRPTVDAWLYETLHTRVFTWDDCGEVGDGVCRLLPPLTHTLSETAPAWRAAVAPQVEQVARALHADISTLALPSALIHLRSARRGTLTVQPFPTRLTHENKRRSSRGNPRVPPPLTPACRICGVILAGTTRRYCDTCSPAARLEDRQRMARAAHEGLSQLRAHGDDPAKRAETREKHTQAAAEQHRRMVEFGSTHRQRYDPGIFRTRILPTLRTRRNIDIIRATDLSPRWVRLILAGEKVPHPMHWETLAELAGVEFSLDTAVLTGE
jgi:CRISPR-associated protein Cas1